MLRLVPRAWQYSAVFVREAGLLPYSPATTHSRHVSRETYSARWWSLQCFTWNIGDACLVSEGLSALLHHQAL